MNGQSGTIGDLNEKWVKGQARPYGNKELKTKKEKMRNKNECVGKHGLTLKWIKGQTRPYGFKEYKGQKCGLSAHFFEHITFLRERREEKREKKARVARYQVFGWLCSPLLAPKRSNNLEEKIRRG